jgi:hypothetical protein
MVHIRLKHVVPLDGFRVRLLLTDGSEVERDLAPLLAGPVFEAIRADPQVFHRVQVDGGTLVWPNGADLCPDVVIWGGPPPADESVKPERADNLSRAQ